VTQIKGPASNLLGNYVENLHKKLEKVAESIVMSSDPDVVTPSKPQLLAARKNLLQKIGTLFAEILQTELNKKALTYHASHILISFVLRVLSPEKIITLASNPTLNW